MNKKSLLTAMFLGLLAIAGCERDSEILDPPPAAPQGVYSVTGDNEIFLYWNGPYEADIKEYVIMRSFEEFENYVELGRVAAEPNPNLDLLIYEYIDRQVQNGKTYFYAVRTIDKLNQSSDLSAESVFDTPRPQGAVTLYPASTSGNIAGFNLATETVVDYTSDAADFYLVYDETLDVHFLTVGNALIDIQDMGYTYDFDAVSYAPDDGWSKFIDMEIILNHTYVLWTDSENYAKIRPIQIFPGSKAVRFQWAYQTVPNNRELKIIPPEN